MTSDYLKKYEVTNDFLTKYDMYASEFDVRERIRRRRRKLAAVMKKDTVKNDGIKKGFSAKMSGDGTRAVKRHWIMAGRLRMVLVVTAVCFLMILSGYIGAYNSMHSGAGTSFTAQAAEETVYKSIVIQSGDTLWGIAGEYSEPSKDIRKQIREICELNGIEPGGIYPGQMIIVPVPAHLA